MQKPIVSSLFFKYPSKESHRILLELENVLKRLLQLSNICLQWVRTLPCRGETALTVSLAPGMSREPCFTSKPRTVSNHVSETTMSPLLRARLEKRKTMRSNHLMMLSGTNACIYSASHILELYSRLVLRAQDIVSSLAHLSYSPVTTEAQLKGIRQQKASHLNHSFHVKKKKNPRLFQISFYFQVKMSFCNVVLKLLMFDMSIKVITSKNFCFN